MSTMSMIRMMRSGKEFSSIMGSDNPNCNEPLLIGLLSIGAKSSPLGSSPAQIISSDNGPKDGRAEDTKCLTLDTERGTDTRLDWRKGLSSSCRTINHDKLISTRKL